MLISVTERTAEIGVRKTAGARKADIRGQFLLEAITLSCPDRARGAHCDSGLCSPGSSWASRSPSAWGYFSETNPADRAANLDPIVCLRYE
jgi:putative ABC transport system permease protein